MSFMTEQPRPPDDDPTARYQPPGGYPPPPYNPPPGYGYKPPSTAGDERTWILVAHFGGAAGAFFGGTFFGWIAPLVALLARGNTSPYVREEAVKALNFQLLWGIIGLVGSVLICVGVGFFIVGAAWLIATILGVVAGVKAANNEPFNYPLSARFIR
ncbi:hypothetical protein GCM10010109_46700 [Actinoplanes campanulatus]|nr:hypothetical protein GCM10010109_46700 [Actinoplanes campanulatus]GID39053.1 hypothetical protein Aca09nite_55590 [Actinoplanes campanulatus]